MPAQPVANAGASHAPEMTPDHVTAPDSHRARWLLLITGVLVVALVLRLWKLGAYEPNDDELIDLAGFDDALAHPPLYAWVLSLVRPLTHNLALLRMPSHVFVARQIPLSQLRALGLLPRCHQLEGPAWLPPSQSWWECPGHANQEC